MSAGRCQGIVGGIETLAGIIDIAEYRRATSCKGCLCLTARSWSPLPVLPALLRKSAGPADLESFYEAERLRCCIVLVMSGWDTQVHVGDVAPEWTLDQIAGLVFGVRMSFLPHCSATTTPCGMI